MITELDRRITHEVANRSNEGNYVPVGHLVARDALVLPSRDQRNLQYDTEAGALTSALKHP